MNKSNRYKLEDFKFYKRADESSILIERINGYISYLKKQKDTQ